MIYEIVSIVVSVMTVISILFAIIVYFMDKKRSKKLATLEAYDRLQRDVLDELNR